MSVVERSPERIVLDVNATGRALLVVSEVYYPGWQVTIDGTPASLLQVDHVLRGVPVAAGEHLVVMQYQPGTWRAGAAISLASLAALASGLALTARRWPGPTPPADGAGA